MYYFSIEDIIFLIILPFYRKLGSVFPSSSDITAASVSSYTAFLNSFRLKYILDFLSRNYTYMGSCILDIFCIFYLYLSKCFSANFLSPIVEAISAIRNTSCKSITCSIGGALGSNVLLFRISSHFYIFL